MKNNTHRKGKFIVFYGINNLGKSTQAHKLVERIKKEKEPAEYLKYPIYELEPSGKIINNYLRENNKYQLSTREVQILYAFNRTQYESQLLKKINSGINIVSEDYTGTGLAWGITTGVEEDFLKHINAHLLKEDVALLFDGDRFVEAQEKDHKHESNDDFMKRARDIHLQLGKNLNWQKINANQDIELVHKEIWDIVEKYIK